MEILIDVKNVVVLVRDGHMDKVVINTNNLAPTAWPYKDPGDFVMDVTKDMGEQYVIKNFGIIPQIIKV